MAALGRRMNAALSGWFPERRLFVQSRDATRYIRLTPVSQLLGGAAALALGGWMAVATAAVVLDLVSADSVETRTLVLHEAYQTRLNELAAERDQRAAEALSAQSRFQVAMDQISRQQTAILQSVEEQRELDTALDLMRKRLSEAVAQRDDAAETNDRLLAQVTDAQDTLTRSGNSDEDRTLTLQAVSGALAEAVEVRDAATAERAALAEELAALELRMAVNTRRQNDMVDELEQAVAMSFGPLEALFARTDLDVDSLIATVRRNHTGQGGPLTPVGVSTRSFDTGLNTRLDELMIDLDRMNLLRIAAGKVPYATPVTAANRFTSPFGMRTDPVRGGRRHHKGIDLAAPMGTPIYATADGVVTTSGRESGYGNVVRIEHAFGFTTLYGHMSRLRVEEGQQVSRGDRIGDMGTTGRSTGVHLHYEVHRDGEPVNPMTFLEAAKDVF